MRRSLVLAAILVAATVAGVRIADPSSTENEAEVSFSDSPAVIAADSVRSMQTKKVTVKIQSVIDSETRDETYRKHAEVRAEHDTRRYLAVRSTDNDSDWEIGFFGTEGMGWTTSPYTDWGRAPSSRHPGFGTVLDPAAMEQSDARVIVDNATMLVVRFEDDDANDAVRGLDAHTEPALPGHLDLYVDKQRKLPVRAVRIYENPERNTTVHVRYRFTRYGETEVERPEDVPKFSIWELLGDIYYG